MSDGQSDSRREMDSGGWTLTNAPPVRSSAGLSGAELIARERARQISAEGWTPEHDDAHKDGELIAAAVSYAMPQKARDIRLNFATSLFEAFWPWDMKWWKPSDDHIRNLTKAGALIAAEIDRLKRSQGKPGNSD